MRLAPVTAARAALGAGLAAALLMGASAPKGVSVPLGPGRVTGGVNPYRASAGDTVGGIATRFAVHPVRVSQPNADNLRDGLEPGEVVYIDQRRITPTFHPSVSGVVLNVPEAHIYVVDQGDLIKDYPAGVSQSDWKVPLGTTQVVLKEQDPTWHVPPKIQAEMAAKGLPVKTEVPPGPNNPLGTRWIGFADGTYGFHGTLEPGSIKRYASHGCVRMLKPDLHDLFARVEVGTPVRVYHQPVKLALDGKAIFLAVYPDHYGLGYDFKGAVRALAEEARVAGQIDWKAVDRALTHRDGMLADVAASSQVTPPPAAPASGRP